MEFYELNNPFQKKKKLDGCQKSIFFFTYPYVALNEHTWRKQRYMRSIHALIVRLSPWTRIYNATMIQW